jgi:raffinose/stachyose/melibiose transport system substrate-binding protein
MKRQIISVLMCVVLFVFAGGQMAVAKDKLVMWDVMTANVVKDLIDSTVQDFNKANPDVELEAVHIQNDPYKTKLKVAMGGGTPPDIFHNWGGGPLKEYIDSGMVAPIDEIKADLLKTYIPAAFDPATFDGKTYGTPYTGLTGVYFFYRKDIFAKYNLTPPKTWNEFLEVGETLKKNGIIPITLGNKTKWPGSFYYMYLADRVGGADMFLNALYRKNNVTFEDPGYIKAGQLVQELVKRDFFPQGFNGMEEDTGQARALIYTGKAAMFLMGNWFIGAANAEAPDVLKDIDFFTFPAVEGGKGDPTNLIGSPGQNYLSIASTCKNKEAAMKFLKEYIMSKSYIEFLVDKAGYVPPVKNAASYVKDPMMKKIAQTFEAAGHVQVYYDQFMSPAMGEKHKDLVQALFGLTITPEEMAKGHETAILEELKK